VRNMGEGWEGGGALGWGGGGLYLTVVWPFSEVTGSSQVPLPAKGRSRLRGPPPVPCRRERSCKEEEEGKILGCRIQNWC